MGHSINKQTFLKKAKWSFFFNFFIILFLQKFLFWGNSKRQQIKQGAPSLNRSLSSNLLWLRSANHVKFTEECEMFTKKHVLIRKMFTNQLDMCLPLWVRVKKTVHGVIIHWLSGIRIVLSIEVSKEGHTDCVLGYKKTHHYWFPWKKCNC